VFCRLRLIACNSRQLDAPGVLTGEALHVSLTRMMIDKLDVRVPAVAEYTREFSELYCALRNDRKGPFHETKHYLAAADLRQFGYDVILHTHCKHGREGNHKLELVDAGKRGFDFLAHEVRRIYNVNPADMGLIRVDLAADVPRVPVSWFLSRVRAKWKRFHNAASGNLEYMQMGSRGIETLYVGKRPNCFRIYNKIAEWRSQYQRLLRRVSHDAETPSFEECYGYAEDFVLTRVERQCGGGRIPKNISTFGGLRRHAPDFNPFQNLDLTATGLMPAPEDFEDLKTFAFVMWSRERIAEWGRHAYFQWVNQYTGGNASRTFKKYGQWLGVDLAATLTLDQLYDYYYSSVTRQLAA